MHLARKLGEGREGYDQSMASTAIDECVTVGLKATDYYKKRKAYSNESGDIRHGIGMSIMIHGSGIAGLDMGAATIKLNDDGSFNLLIGATDLGTGSDTILAQMAAEKLIGQVILGGITRLTGSGLSITSWDIITGVIPPISKAL